MRRPAVAAVAGLAALLTAAGPADAATVRVATWKMNDPVGSTTMVDSSGDNDGTIGSDVRLSGRTFFFPFRTPSSGARPEHLVTVPDAPGLSPGSGDWAVTVRFKTTRSFGHVLQKGQAGSAGGYFKMRMPNGVVSCLFRGAAGSRSVNSRVPLNDGQWHVVSCKRAGDTVTMTVDGTTTSTSTGPTGLITNQVPFTIGGKPNCDGVKVTCDYWSGEVDYVWVAAG